MDGNDRGGAMNLAKTSGLERWPEISGEARKPRNRRPMRIPAATPGISPLQSHIILAVPQMSSVSRCGCDLVASFNGAF
jgi:hypothetical protein